MTEAVEALSERLHHLLQGKTVKLVRLTDGELLIEFSNGERLFVDATENGSIEVSVT